MALLVIHTGGTIGMIETAEGYATQQGVVETAVKRMGARTLHDRIDVVCLSPLIDSAQATPEDWDKIAQAISAAYDLYDSFVVTHGTDTLAYTAAALCLALPGLTKPVIMTGAMLPLTVEGNDGARNLQEALTTALDAPAGVWVQFAGKQMHGGRIRKAHSHAFDAFTAEATKVPPAIKADSIGHVPVTAHDVAVISITPGLSTKLVDHAANTCDGIILRCYGSGTAPDSPEFRAALETAAARQIPVIAISQCPEGGMHMGTYATDSFLRARGVLDGRDMTLEMAYVKLQYALSSYPTLAEQQAYLTTDQCGEYSLS